MPGENTQTPEPKVVEEVKAEIKKLGEGYEANKANYVELRKSHEDFKSELDNSLKANEGRVDALLEEKLTKLSEDVTTRQEDIDTKIVASEEREKDINKRIDDFEVMLKRSPKAGSVEVKDLIKLETDARDFMINAMTVKGIAKGVKEEELMNLEVNMDEFKAYAAAFPRFLRLDDRHHITNPEMLKSLTVGIDPDGGYTVTPFMSNRIITRMFETDPIRQLASIESITTDAIEWSVDYDEAGWGWEAETEAGPETDTPKLKQKRIPVHVMYAKPRVSQTLLEDSAINIERWLGDHIARRFSRGEGASFVSGDGVGKPRGFLTYDNYDTAGVDQWAKIEQQAMGNATALTADGFIDVLYRLVESYLNRATWLMHRLTVAATMQLKNGQGDYIWKPGIAEGRYSTILGQDVRMSTTMPTVAANALAVAVADWREAYMVVDRLGITVQRDPYTQKPMIEFYSRKRVGGDVINFQAIKLGVIST